MSRAARLFWVCAVTAGLCFVALAILSKGSIEPQGMVIFDSRLTGYTPDEAQAFLAALTPDQTRSYLGTFRQLDTVFPILLALSLIGAIWLNTSGETSGRRVLACFGAALYLVFDLTENATVAKLLAGEGSEMFADTVARASTLTQAKWMCLALSLLVALWAWRFAAKQGRPA